MLLAVAAIVAFGLYAMAGITRDDVARRPDHFLYRQFVFVAVGVVALSVAVLVDPDIYRRHWRQLYVGTLVLFAVVFLAGTVARGSRRWIDLGFFRFQPSEFGKTLIVLALAGYLAERYKRIGEPRVVLSALGLALPPMLLVFIQPDIGSALVYVAAIAAVLFVAGVRWPHLILVWAVVGLMVTSVFWLLPAAGVHVLKRTSSSGSTGFLHPGTDPRGSTYNSDPIDHRRRLGRDERAGRRAARRRRT